jgi:ATP-dependent DNA ligase
VVESVLAMPARELILDGEVLTFTPDGRPAPFQITMRRFGRKLDIGKMRSEPSSTSRSVAGSLSSSGSQAISCLIC